MRELIEKIILSKLWYYEALGLLIDISQLARDVDAMLGKNWPNGTNGGPMLTQHWVSVSCLLDMDVTTYGKDKDGR